MAKKKEHIVLKAFKDKNTLDVYGVGESYSADAKRVKELQGKGFLSEELKDDADESRETPPQN